MEKYFGKSEVKGNIKPLPVAKRKIPHLILGSTYYISFGRNISYMCTLLEIINEFGCQEVKVQRQGKASKMIHKMDGTKSQYFTQENILYSNEIGETPEESILNQVHW